MEGHITGMIIPAQVSKRHLNQVLGEIRAFGGVRFVVTPRTNQDLAGPGQEWIRSIVARID